ncbi:MAG: glyoxalase [Lachnospiraceae bacterium]|nr:glyoxalase [Lachnospiraceae bacterium]
MPEFDDAVLDAFLEQQEKLFPEQVAGTREEAREFLEETFAVVLANKKEVWEYFNEEGIDLEELGEDDITSADEVFAVGDGRFLIVEA